MAIDTEAADCTLRPEMLRGAWARASQAGFFEQMEFNSERGRNSFSSWLHDRPEISGATWTLEDCVLRITGPDDSSLSFVYVASMNSRSQLELREPSQPVAKYRRVKE
jgi:hypothetical protein